MDRARRSERVANYAANLAGANTCGLGVRHTLGGAVDQPLLLFLEPCREKLGCVKARFRVKRELLQKI